MTTVASVTPLTAQGANDKASASGFKTLGKNDFLNLLVQQIQHQDPLNPMDSSDFTAQLAQFSQLEQLTQVNDNLVELKNYEASINNAQAISLIGKSIKVKGNEVDLKEGGAATLGYRLEQDAASVNITITNEAGEQVASLVAGNQASGANEMHWNGKDGDGNQLPGGLYTFEVVAKDSDGNVVKSETYSLGQVTGVTFVEGQPYLITENGKYALGDVISVEEGDKTETADTSTSSDSSTADGIVNTQNG